MFVCLCTLIQLINSKNTFLKIRGTKVLKSQDFLSADIWHKISKEQIQCVYKQIIKYG